MCLVTLVHGRAVGRSKNPKGVIGFTNLAIQGGLIFLPKSRGVNLSAKLRGVRFRRPCMIRDCWQVSKAFIMTTLRTV